MMKHLYRCATVFFFCLLIGACSDVPIAPPNMPSALDPHGAGADRIAALWWVMLALGTVIFLLVTALLFAALLRRRRATSDTAPDRSSSDIGRNWPIFGGIALPFVVIGIVFGYSIYTLAKIENPQ
jgi:cytochrome c oxidase subunit 2